MKLWRIGKRHGFTTQIQYFRDRFESPALGAILFPILNNESPAGLEACVGRGTGNINLCYLENRT